MIDLSGIDDYTFSSFMGHIWQYNYYFAVNKKVNKPCMIKDYWVSALTDIELTDLKKNFCICCPYLVKYMDVFTLEKYPSSTFFVMERCRNPYLNGELKDLTSTRILEIFSQLTIGVFVLHMNKIIHGNINPEAIFMDEENTCKLELGGFGTSLMLTETMARSSFSTFADCIAPEMRFRGSFSYPSDMYSLGATINELYKHSSARNEDIPDFIKTVINKLVSPVPSDRTPIQKLVLVPAVRELIEWNPHIFLPSALREYFFSNPAGQVPSLNSGIVCDSEEAFIAKQDPSEFRKYLPPQTPDSQKQTSAGSSWSARSGLGSPSSVVTDRSSSSNESTVNGRGDVIVTPHKPHKLRGGTEKGKLGELGGEDSHASETADVGLSSDLP